MRHGTRLGLLLALLFVAFMLLPLVTAQPVPVEERGRDTTLSEGRSVTPSGDVISDIWVKVIWVSAAIFLLVSVMLVYALIRWRHRRGENREVPQIHGNSKLEIAWTIGPALIMVWLLVISYNGLFAIDDPDTNPDHTIEVIGHAFFWEYVYPDGSSSTGGDSVLRLQENSWFQLNVTSADVHHAFKIPGLDVMIDAMPGRQNQVYVNTGVEPGVYFVQCMRFCGAGHSEMWSTVEIFPEGEQELPYGAPPREPAQAPVDPTPDGGNETAPPPDDNGTDEPTDNGTDEPTDNGTDAEPERTVEVDLFDYFFDPAPLEVEPGETVEVRVTNTGPAPHDLNFGVYDHEASEGEVQCTDPENEETCWRSQQSMPVGEEDTFVFTAPEEPVAFSMWCSVPGHVQQGMISSLSVGGAVLENEAPQPRLPGPAFGVLVFVLGGIVFLVRRYRT